MFTMFKAIFDAITAYAIAFGNLGKAAESATAVVRENAKTYEDTARIERERNLAKLMHETAQEEAGFGKAVKAVK